MKPRFSILMLLGVTAVLAIDVAAICYPESCWNSMMFHLWLVVICLLGATAFATRSAASVFAGSFVIACLGYVALVSFEHANVEYYSAELPIPPLPHHYAITFLYDPAVEGRFPGSFAAEQNAGYHSALQRFAVTNTSFAVGLFVAGFALWRYRVLERRETKEKSGE